MTSIATMPRDGNSNAFPLLPAKLSLATTYDTTVSTTTQVTFNSSTTIIEVTALVQPILIRWGTSSASTSTFDSIIAAGTTRHYVIPTNTTTGSLYTAANFIEQAASATLVVSEF